MFERKRAAVLREAGRAFAKRGFHNTSLDDVAAALDVTKAALYTYVKTKNEILYECHKISMDLGESALDSALRTEGSAADKLERFLELYIGHITREDGMFAILSEIDALSPGDRAKIVKRRDAFEKRVGGLLRAGVEDGSLEPVDPKVVIFAFMGAMHWVARWFDSDGRISSSEMAKSLSDVLMRGVRRRSAP
jgi:AcrR family transcriptional regulator